MPALSRASAGKPDVSGKERHRDPRADRLGEPGRLRAVDADPLPPGVRSPGGGKPAHLAAALDLGADVEPAAAEAGHVLVGRAAQRAVQYGVVHRLEEIGLSLAVVAQEDDSLVRHRPVERREIAEAPRDEVLEPHYSMIRCRIAVSPRTPSRSVAKIRTSTA